MSDIAIITARAGSREIPNKSMFPVHGLPLIWYPIHAAKNSKWVSKIFIATDGVAIAEFGRRHDCAIIWRPDELRGDHVNHGDVIKHAVEQAEQEMDEVLESVVLLLGNSAMVTGKLIDLALAKLQFDQTLHSVMTVWQAADDHPLRALRLDEQGLLHSYEEREVSTERQSYPRAFFYDQGIWAFRKECVQGRAGPNPWWWMGENCAAIVRPWVGGRDVHNALDIEIAEWWRSRTREV